MKTWFHGIAMFLVLFLNLASGHALTSITSASCMAESLCFFNHQNKTRLKSPCSVLKSFVWGTVHLRLPQCCVVRVHVTHNQVYLCLLLCYIVHHVESIDFHVTRSRQAVACVRKTKFHGGRTSVLTNLFHFHTFSWYF